MLSQPWRQALEQDVAGACAAAGRALRFRRSCASIRSNAKATAAAAAPYGYFVNEGLFVGDTAVETPEVAEGWDKADAANLQARIREPHEFTDGWTLIYAHHEIASPIFSAFDPSKRPSPHSCKTSWRVLIRPEDLCGRFEKRELCPCHLH